VAYDAAGEQEARAHALGLEPRVSREQILSGVARGENPEDVLHGEAVPANDRFSAEDLRIDRDPAEQIRSRIVVH